MAEEPYGWDEDWDQPNDQQNDRSNQPRNNGANAGPAEAETQSGVVAETGGRSGSDAGGIEGLDDDEAEEVLLAGPDEEYEPTDAEMTEYCEWLGMDLDVDRPLMWIAREALKAPLPDNWKICHTDDREVYYFNVETGESIWDHPMDAYYKSLYRQEKAKLDKKRLQMRLFAGSLPILPLADFFSEVVGSFGQEEQATWTNIPDALVDAIDFRIYVDPVVLPSGRTVSKRTIINTKWKDPFTREYVENRRLVPNVDKRNEVDSWLMTASSAYMDLLQPTVEGVEQLVKLLPYALDKEDDVCIRLQGQISSWVARHSQVAAEAPVAESKGGATGSGKPTPQKKRNGGRQENGGRSLNGSARDRSTASSTAIQQPPHQQNVVELLSALPSDRQSVLLGALLTMSTGCSRELLLSLMLRVPKFSSNAAFYGFSDEVLNVLHLSTADVTRIATTIQSRAAATNADHDPYVVTHSDQLLSLRWVGALIEVTPPVNVLHKLDFKHALFVVRAMWATRCLRVSATSINNIFRGIEGYPHQLANVDDSDIEALLELCLADEAPLSQATTLYDVLLHGKERGLDYLKSRRAAIINNLIDVATNAANGAQVSSSSPLRARSPLPPSSCVDLLAALMVFHELARLDDFAAVPGVALRIGYNLLPRLTRLQWRPKHFDATVTKLVALVERNPAMAWETMPSSGVLFLIRELSRKKRSAEEVRSKLEAIEAAERRLEQQNAIVNWAILGLRMQLKMEPAAGGPSRKESGKQRRDGSASGTQSKAGSGKWNGSFAKSNEVVSSTTKGQKAEKDRTTETRAETPPAYPPSGRSHAHDHHPTSTGGTIEQRLQAAMQRKADLQQERASNTVSALQTLLAMRLKPKNRGQSEVGNNRGKQPQNSSRGEKDSSLHHAPSSGVQGSASSLSHFGSGGSFEGERKAPPSVPPPSGSMNSARATAAVVNSSPSTPATAGGQTCSLPPI